MARSRLRRTLFKKERYHQGPSPLDDQSREQRRQTRGQESHIKRNLILVAALVFLALALYQFGFIRQVEVAGLDSETSLEVSQLAEDYINRSWYSSFKPLSDVQGLAGSIELADSRFSGTQAQLEVLGSKVIISSTVRTPAANWQVNGDTNTYLMDTDGVVYEDEEVDSRQLPVIRDMTGLQAELGSQAASTNVLDFILLLDERISAEGLFPRQSRTYLLAESPKDVRLEAGASGYQVKFTTDRGASDQAAELKVILKYLDDVNRTPSTYIDLRVDDTGYYL
jgi:hypothetical protein